ncbi:helix-turn-helix domain-containing protein [Streptosporangium carneum]|uniref:HTH cro/C1-type domain-containing protein n=1 Tax=Streptosporangium carneum TaxID=47481 RepID=A0A9W6IA45_9ACTN|nr:helix-turn-helix domain-containing protein [Streptosporangium carneum]GLK13934.1 hypothetical protein GCM10017600_73460 [Streptosporangium carneum]
MGRSETPLDPAAGSVPRFAYELRKLRQEAGGLTYREMARRAGYSITALSRAAAGQQLASWPVVAAYVQACDGDVAVWQARWRQVADEQASPAPSEEGEEQAAPYQGLAHYNTADHDRFFGRQRLLEQLTELLGRHRFAAVFGPSGSGKSSLLRAGLIPAARKGALGEPVPEAVVFTPGAHPMREHADTLTTSATRGGGGLVVVDQFEELFTLCADPLERAAFIDALLEAARPGGGRVVLAVRADFFGRCAEHPGLTHALQGATVLVGPMSREELREAIVKPAAAAGLIVERALTVRIVDEVVREPGGLPLMSHALLETWRRRRGTLLTLEGYERAGGVHGAIAATAERLYTRLPPQEADQAKRVLLRLVNPGDQAADTRCPAFYDDFNPAACPEVALEQLAQARLVTLHEHHVELAHEALISAWPRLRTWIDQERELLRLRRRLGEAATIWHDHNRDPGALYQGARLAAAQPLLGRPDDLTVTEHAFLNASVQAAERAEHAAARRKKLARLAVAVLAVLAVVASGAAVAAVTAARQADAQGKEVLARLIAKSSDELAATDPALSGLLAAASWHFAPTDEARHGMLATLAGSLRGVLNSSTGAVNTAVFSPDGRTLATGNDDGEVRLWEVATRRSFRVLPTGSAHGSSVHTMAFSPDGTILAAAGGQSVQLWNVATRRPLATLLTNHITVVTLVRFSPDGATLHTVSANGTVQRWDVASRRLITSLSTARVTTVLMTALSPDGDTVAVAPTDDRRLQLWDVTTRRMTGTLFIDGVSVYRSVRFSPDGRLLATFGQDEPVRLWEVATGRLIGKLPVERAGELAFSLDGRLLATSDVGTSSRIRLWDLTTRRLIDTPLTGHSQGISDLIFSPDGRLLATTSRDGTTRLWDTTLHRPTDVPATGHALGVNAVAFSPDGRLLATAEEDTTLRLWNVATHHLIGAPLTGHGRGVTAVAFSPDGTTLATGDDNGSARLWNVTTRRLVGAPLTGHGRGVTAVAFSPDGTTLATAGKDGAVQLWDTATHRPIGTPLTSDLSLTDANAVAFSPDGRLLATTGSAWGTQLWDVRTRRLIGAPLTSHAPSVVAVAFSPDGTTLATTDDATVRLWDVATRRPLGAPLTGHTDTVTGLAFSPDGTTLASAGKDRHVQLWDVATRRPIGTPMLGHDGAVNALAFSPDGRLLVTGGADKTVRLWAVKLPTDPSAAVCAVMGRSLTPQEWQQYVPGQPYQRICP